MSTGRLKAEAPRVLRFGVVGILATAVHLLVLTGLIRSLAWPALISNLLAFCCAFGVSFLGNYHWTFRSTVDPRVALRRFVLTSLIVFGLNSALLALLAEGLQLDPLVAGVTAAVMIPALTYLASRLWVFREPALPRQ